jgi:transcriptional regulator with XRE-family HTH domain
MAEKDPVMKEIGTYLQLIRKELDIMQKDFADELGISGASLSEIEATIEKDIMWTKIEKEKK